MVIQPRLDGADRAVVSINKHLETSMQHSGDYLGRAEDPITAGFKQHQPEQGLTAVARHVRTSIRKR